MAVTLSDWLYRAVLSKSVLTLNRDYFLLRKPLERRIYELARKHCGRQAQWRVSVETLCKKSGSNSPRRVFRAMLREIVAAGHLPDYRLEEEPGEPEELGQTAELEADENVPSLAEVQLALAQCNYDEEVIDATCTTGDNAEQFTCRYKLESDLPETDRELTMAADGTSYSLVEVPEDCPIQ